jgi:propionate CoA-transferase
VSRLLEPLAQAGQRVAALVNYDNFSIPGALLDDYAAMAQRLTARYYSRVTRYGTGGFLKARLDAGATSR